LARLSALFGPQKGKEASWTKQGLSTGEAFNLKEYKPDTAMKGVILVEVSILAK
jgi:hypothetical protein